MLYYPSETRPPQAVTFDDVLFVPQYSDIESRANVDISTTFLGRRFDLPFISANMDTVTGPLMAMTMNTLRGGRYFTPLCEPYGSS